MFNSAMQGIIIIDFYISIFKISSFISMINYRLNSSRRLIILFNIDIINLLDHSIVHKEINVIVLKAIHIANNEQ